jgi:hypothetical protein
MQAKMDFHMNCFLGNAAYFDNPKIDWDLLEIRVSKMNFSPLHLVVQGCRMLADHDRSDHLSVLKKLIQHDVNLNSNGT